MVVQSQAFEQYCIVSCTYVEKKKESVSKGNISSFVNILSKILGSTCLVANSHNNCTHISFCKCMYLHIYLAMNRVTVFRVVLIFSFSNASTIAVGHLPSLHRVRILILHSHLTPFLYNNNNKCMLVFYSEAEAQNKVCAWRYTVRVNCIQKRIYKLQTIA